MVLQQEEVSFLNQRNDGALSLDLSKNPKGIYLVQLIFDDKMMTTKIISH
ncbi:MAG: T9SS type A sorting domain-containing protein [Saprospiraceae bacterium]|nr:T9SS type A sorting domain-containing protein [Saprospiraceae bacterium]